MIGVQPEGAVGVVIVAVLVALILIGSTGDRR